MNNQIQILDNSDNGWEKIGKNNIVLLFQTIMTKYPIMYDVDMRWQNRIKLFLKILDFQLNSLRHLLFPPNVHQYQSKIRSHL